ncbi:hypothetical protein CL630_01645 [bacterium]|nr:hypothetical protein [bacterium]|tara:strand:- start:19584 stop:20327 length:744 start_codon:yes stop_codon:yes gene_type:complete
MSKKTIITLITFLLVGGSIGGYKIVKDNRATAFENDIHAVVKVIDGDTIDIENKKRIRLLGIDSPERKTCYYQESKDALTELLNEKDIRIEKDISGTDRYDRFLRYIYISADDPEDDDLFVNEWLVREGHAFKNPIAPNNRYLDLLARAQEEAREAERGLWSDTCEYTAEYKDAKSLREQGSEAPNKDCIIKGNISEKAYGRLYFLEGCPNYNRIKIDPRKGEQWFCTEKEAEAAGFTRSASCDTTF